MNSNGKQIKRIGLFDSGVGGLSILRFLQKQAVQLDLPVKFVYFADTARCPYGNRSSDDIRSFVEQIVSFLDSSGVDAIVMACNTSAAVAAHKARELSSAPVHDLIAPTAKYVANQYKRIGVIATATTCQKRAFSNAIWQVNPSCKVLEIAAPDLVPLVESGKLDGPEVEATISKYVDELKAFEADSLIFGCTHFPFLEQAFRRLLPDINFVDPAVHLGVELLGIEAIEKPQALSDSSVFKKNVYFTTGSADAFAMAAERCLGLSAGTLSESICGIGLDQIESFQIEPLPEIAQTGSHTVLLDSQAQQLPNAAQTSFLH